MAEALGVASSVAGLVSLAIQLSQISFQYVSSVKSSSKAWSSYIQELSTLTSVLLKLQQAYDGASSGAGAGAKDLSHILPAPGLSSDCIKECHKELESLKATLSGKLQKRGLRGKLEMLSWPYSEPDTQAKVLALHRFSNLFESSLAADNLIVSIENYRHFRDMKDVKAFEQLLDWFKPTYESSPLSSEAVLEWICPGTRSDLLSSEVYVNWRDSIGENTEQPLWIHGPPGSGKSILSAAIVNDIMSCPDTITAYHFFKDNQEETMQDVLRHISYQLLSQPTAVMSTVVMDICRTKMSRNAPLAPKNLVEVVCDISVTSCGRTYIILDGLDEFPHSIKLLKHLSQFVASKAKVIVSSRELPSIMEHLTNATRIDARAGCQDLEMYVRWRLEEDSEVDEDLVTDDLKREIVSKLVEKANGSFLLARLIMDSICNATTIKKMRQMLDLMPTNYEEAYEGTFDRILKQDPGRKTLALSVLSWVCNSRRLLDMTELQHAIASLDNAPEYTLESLEPGKTILSSCLGFLVFSKSSETVDLVHISVRDFVLEQLNSQVPSSNITIGRACLRYMAVPEMAKGPCRSLDDLKTRITTLPFLDYATRYYGYHIRPVEDDLLSDLETYLSDRQFRDSSWQLLHFVVKPESQSAQELISGVPSQATILHVACYWGFSSLLRKSLAIASAVKILDKGDSHGWRPLHWASSNGHPQLALALLEAGANVNAVDQGSWTPLFWAVVRGHENVARLLLDRGSNPVEVDRDGFTPLHWAILSGAGNMTTLLLEHTKERDPESPHLSSPISRLTVAEAKAIARPEQPINLFKLAVEVSDKDSFEKLVCRYNSYRHYLSQDPGFALKDLGALWERTKIVLSKGDRFFWRRTEKMAPIDGARKEILTNAIQLEDVGLVKAMLNLSRDLGKDLASDVVSYNGASYAHVAAHSGSMEIMRMISKIGVPLTATDSMGLTPLHYACRTGSPKIVEIILDADVKVDAREKNHQRTPLMLLLKCGGWRTCHAPGETLVILKALIARGASIHAKDLDGLQAIHFSMATIDPEVLQTLVDLGADPLAVSNNLRTPLHLFAEGYNHDFTLESEGFSRKFSDYEVPNNLVDTFTKLILRISSPKALLAETAANATALALAIRYERWILAQALYAADAPFRYDHDLSRVFQIVAKNGFYQFVRILVKAGHTQKDEDFFPCISVELSARKPHPWRHDELADISGSGAFPHRNHALTLKELLALGINVNHKSQRYKSTAIQIAAERGIDDTSYLAALLEGGADPYATTDDGLDSFDLALQCGKLDNLAILVQHAIHDQSRDNWLTNWLRESGTVPQAGQDSFEACISAIRNSKRYTLLDRSGHTYLFHAVRAGNMVFTEELIKLGSDVNFGHPSGWTPFHEAIYTGRADLVALLISKGANLNATVRTAGPPNLNSSASRRRRTDGEERVINALHIAVGIYSVDVLDENPLSPDIVRLLLENGIDPSAKAIDCDGPREYSKPCRDATPLQIMFGRLSYLPKSCQGDFFDIVQMLVDSGADVRGISEGLLPWEIALFEGRESLWEIFRNAEEEPKN